LQPVKLLEEEMSAHFQTTTIIDRPLGKVFHFIADEHVRNHPRWDPDIELWLDSDEPIQVGTVIQRRNSRSGTPVDGTMQVVVYEPNRAIGMVIQDGSVVMNGRITFEAQGENQTAITTTFEILGMDDSMDKSFLNSRLERRDRNIKRLIESEV
jgi:hypothetical protein